MKRFQAFISKLVLTMTLYVSYTYFILVRLKLNKVHSKTVNPIHERPSSQTQYHSLRHRRVARRCTSFNSSRSQVEADKSSHEGNQYDGWDHTHVSRLPKIRKSVSVFTLFTFTTHTVIAIKYMALCLLEIEVLEPLHWLDCITPGRFSILATAPFAAKVIAGFLCFYHVAWRYIMLVNKPDLKLDFIEFMFNSHCDVLKKEIQTWHNKSKYYVELMRAKNEIVYRKAVNSNRMNLWRLERCESIFHVRNPFTGDVNDYRLKNNRTSEAWNILNRIAFLYTVTSLLCLLVIAAILTRSIMPMIFTKRGFELNHYNCLRWIDRQDSKIGWNLISKHLSNYSSIKPSANALLPFENFLPTSYYYLLSMFMDLFENLFVWLETFNALFILTLISVMSSADVLIYTRDVKMNLEKLVRKMQILNVIRQQTSRFNLQKSIHLRAKHFETVEIQSVIIDRIGLINKYSAYSNIYAAFSVVLWLSYCALLVVLTFYYGSPWKIMEWYVILGLSTMLLIIVIGTYALVKVDSVKLYTLIASAMALEPGSIEDKRRWAIILNFYSPTPMCSCRLLSTTELSWLMCFKLIGWVASAFLVVTNLYLAITSQNEMSARRAIKISF